MNELDLVALEAETIFVLSAAGRILRCGSRDNGAGPLLHLAGSAEGNICLMREGVGKGTVSAIEGLVADEPPLAFPQSTPVHLEDFFQVLGAKMPADPSDVMGLLWTFPERLDYEHPARLVTSGTPEGAALLARLEEAGMPDYLVDAGFVDTGEFWAPWCVAFEGDQLASIAFSPVVGPKSAEVGVYTFPAFRGRGYAAAATAGWAALPALHARTLFYQTSRNNVSSRRVAERLRLRFLGSTLAIS